MHFVFMLSGIREHADELLKWFDTRMYAYPFKNPNLLPNGPKDKDGNIMKEGYFYATGKVRYGVYGTYEICAPEEAKDVIMKTLGFDKFTIGNQGGKITPVKNFLAKLEIEAFRKLIGCEPIPEFNKDAEPFLLPLNVVENVRIIPIGVRYDVKDWTSPTGLVHERI